VSLLSSRPDAWLPLDWMDAMPVGDCRVQKGELFIPDSPKMKYAGPFQVNDGDIIKHRVNGFRGYFRLTARRKGHFCGIRTKASGEIEQVYEEEGGFRKLLAG
jgi:hypothetical protein